MMLQSTDELAAAIRSSWIAAVAITLVVAAAGVAISGWLGGALALGGGALGVGNMRLAAFALQRAPIAFLGSSLPRLAVITAVMVALVFLLGPVGAWGLGGLLATHIAQVGAVLGVGWRSASR